MSSRTSLQGIFSGLRKHGAVVVILLLMLAVAAMYGWKVMAVRNAKDLIRTKAEKLLAQQNAASLRMASLPLAWAVHSEMIRGNMDQINQYLNSF